MQGLLEDAEHEKRAPQKSIEAVERYVARVREELQAAEMRN